MPVPPPSDDDQPERPEDSSVPDEAVPDQAVPDATVPDATVPDQAVPDATAPDATEPRAAGAEVAVPEEVWDRFLTDSMGRIRAEAPKEPSARARVVARRLREQDELAAQRARRRFGSRRPKPLPSPPGWRTGPAWQSPARRRLRAVARTVVPAVIGIGVVLLVMNPSAATSWLHRGAAAPRPSIELTPGAPSASPAAGAATPTTAHPFAGSPAQDWADGAAGIVPPAAAPAGDLGRAQVAAALADTKRYIVATQLDPATLRGAWPAEAEALMAPGNDWATSVRQDIAHPSATHDPLGYLTRYRPSQLRLVGGTVKVRGRMTFSAGERGSVQVHADYTFVYPFVRARGGSGEVSRSIVRQVLTMRVYPAWLAGDAPGKLWLTDTYADDFNTACGAGDGYLHPAFGTAGSGGPAPDSTHSDDPYDTTAPLDTHLGTCGRVTRT